MKLRPRYLAYVWWMATLLSVDASLAASPWQFEKIAESQSLTRGAFFLHTAADLDRNGKKEIVAADFGFYGYKLGEQLSEQDQRYNLYVLEWEKDQLVQRFHKRWDTTRMDATSRLEHFQGYGARHMVAWEFKDRAIVETLPPYLGLEWQNGRYVLHEQVGQFQKTALVGSWAFPWLSPFCYRDFAWAKKRPPRECIVGIRDFSGKGNPKLVTVLETEIVKDKEYKQIVRVRSFSPGFPVEWEEPASKRFVWTDPNDRFNANASAGLFLRVHRTHFEYLFELDRDINRGKYGLRYLPAPKNWDIITFDLPDIYLRHTQYRETAEYWGYRLIKTVNHPYMNSVLVLRKAVPRSNSETFAQDDIEFPRHEPFLGVGYFIVEDIDEDGLDEVILVEETGKARPGHDRPEYYDTKDYIRILKWDGTKYKTMWISPPYTKRGTKFLVADLKGTGKNQLIVLSPYGTIQVWEKKN